MITANRWKLVQECVNRLIIFKKIKKQFDRNWCANKDEAGSRITLDRVFKPHSVTQDPPRVRGSTCAATCFRGLAWPPSRPLEINFQFSFLAETLYDALVFDNQAAANAQPDLPPVTSDEQRRRA